MSNDAGGDPDLIGAMAAESVRLGLHGDDDTFAAFVYFQSRRLAGIRRLVEQHGGDRYWRLPAAEATYLSTFYGTLGADLLRLPAFFRASSSPPGAPDAADAMHAYGDGFLISTDAAATGEQSGLTCPTPTWLHGVLHEEPAGFGYAERRVGYRTGLDFQEQVYGLDGLHALTAVLSGTSSRGGLQFTRDYALATLHAAYLTQQHRPHVAGSHPDPGPDSDAMTALRLVSRNPMAAVLVLRDDQGVRDLFRTDWPDDGEVAAGVISWMFDPHADRSTTVPELLAVSRNAGIDPADLWGDPALQDALFRAMGTAALTHGIARNLAAALATGSGHLRWATTYAAEAGSNLSNFTHAPETKHNGNFAIGGSCEAITDKRVWISMSAEDRTKLVMFIADDSGTRTQFTALSALYSARTIQQAIRQPGQPGLSAALDAGGRLRSTLADAVGRVTNYKLIEQEFPGGTSAVHAQASQSDALFGLVLSSGFGLGLDQIVKTTFFAASEVPIAVGLGTSLLEDFAGGSMAGAASVGVSLKVVADRSAGSDPTAAAPQQAADWLLVNAYLQSGRKLPPEIHRVLVAGGVLKDGRLDVDAAVVPVFEQIDSAWQNGTSPELRAWKDAVHTFQDTYVVTETALGASTGNGAHAFVHDYHGPP